MVVELQDILKIITELIFVKYDTVRTKKLWNRKTTFKIKFLF